MNVSLKTLAPQHGQLHISIEQGDYFPKVQEELKKIRKTAHIKGFRHGAVPESVVKKLYGPGIEAEVLNKMVNELIEKYQKENDTNFLGDLLPLPELSSPADGSVTNHEFFFEVGIAPVANVEDALAKIQLSKNKIILEDTVVEDELNHLKNQYGSLSEIKGPIERGDLIELEVAELLDGAAKQDGIHSSFSLMVDDTLTDEVLEELTGKNVDELLRFNIRTVEKNLDEKTIRKYFLKLTDDDEKAFEDMFEGKISKISRKQAAELGPDLYTKAFGPNHTIQSEDDLRAELRKNLSAYYEKECDKILEIELIKNLNSELNLQFPDDFLKKWLTLSFEEWSKKSKSQFDHDLIHFKEGLSWQMIRNNVIQNQQIQIHYEDLVEAVINQFKSSYPGLNFSDDQWKDIAANTLKDKEKANEFYTNALNDKTFQWLRDHATIAEKEISLEDFRTLVKKLNEHNHEHHEHHHEHEHHDH